MNPHKKTQILSLLLSVGLRSQVIRDDCHERRECRFLFGQVWPLKMARIRSGVSTYPHLPYWHESLHHLLRSLCFFLSVWTSALVWDFISDISVHNEWLKSTWKWARHINMIVILHLHSMIFFIFSHHGKMQIKRTSSSWSDWFIWLIYISESDIKKILLHRYDIHEINLFIFFKFQLITDKFDFKITSLQIDIYDKIIKMNN